MHSHPGHVLSALRQTFQRQLQYDVWVHEKKLCVGSLSYTFSYLNCLSARFYLFGFTMAHCFTDNKDTDSTAENILV